MEEEEEELSRPEMSFLFNVDLELLVDDLPAKTTEDVDEDVEEVSPASRSSTGRCRR